MRPLRYSVNVMMDGCCNHRAIPADEDSHRTRSRTSTALHHGGFRSPRCTWPSSHTSATTRRSCPRPLRSRFSRYSGSWASGFPRSSYWATRSTAGGIWRTRSGCTPRWGRRRAAAHGHAARIRSVLRGLRLVHGRVFLHQTFGVATVSAHLGRNCHSQTWEGAATA
jgi:hypothetical protein